MAFYIDGQLLSKYAVADLVRNPAALPQSVSHYSWQKESAQFDPAANRLTLVTYEEQTYTFDLTTGKVIHGAVPASRGLNHWWWLGGTASVLVVLWIIHRRTA